MKRRSVLVLALLSLGGVVAPFAQAAPEHEFWKWFRKNEGVLFDFERDRERTFDRLAAEMQKVDPGLTFEFGPKRDNRREFIISADGISDVFPKVESLFAAAPALSKWKFIKFRPRRMPFDIEYNGISVKSDSVRVRLKPDGGKIGVTLMIPGFKETDYGNWVAIAFLFLDQALGEYDVATRVGAVEVQGPAGKPGLPVAELAAAFDAYFARR